MDGRYVEALRDAVLALEDSTLDQSVWARVDVVVAQARAAIDTADVDAVAEAVRELRRIPGRRLDDVLGASPRPQVAPRAVHSRLVDLVRHLGGEASS